MVSSVLDVVVRGKAIHDVPVKTDPTPKLHVNEVALNRLKLNIPAYLRSGVVVQNQEQAVGTEDL